MRDGRVMIDALAVGSFGFEPNALALALNRGLMALVLNVLVEHQDSGAQQQQQCQL